MPAKEMNLSCQPARVDLYFSNYCNQRLPYIYGTRKSSRVCANFFLEKVSLGRLEGLAGLGWVKPRSVGFVRLKLRR